MKPDGRSETLCSQVPESWYFMEISLLKINLETCLETPRLVGMPESPGANGQEVWVWVPLGRNEPYGSAGGGRYNRYFDGTI